MFHGLESEYGRRQDDGVVDAGRAATTAVGRLIAVAVPESFAAVTATASLDPTSDVPIAYVDDVAPGIATQSAPSASHRRQLQA